MTLVSKKAAYSAIVVLFLAGGAVFYANSKKQGKVVISSPADLENSGNIEEASHSSEPASQNDFSSASTSDSIEAEEGAGASSSSQSSSSSASSVKSQSEDDSDDSNTQAPDFKIINKLVSFGFQKSSGRDIDTLIVHSSYDAIGSDPYSVSGLIAEYKSYGVSPHYLIDREGNVYRLVEDRNIAYHAGDSKMPDGRTGVNNFSIGVEIMTTKTDKPTGAQYDALNGLIDYLKGKYKMKYILGHDDIAPGRKDDPWNFDWGKVDK
ncbi:MAG: N-acetylmuramoyl-L-alanine amidase [Candidatus Moranbacteria bacterium]|nr:N-acetylmuramoyl-L-alanine amidase [Candidatus Moranbacteria bacterium]